MVTSWQIEWSNYFSLYPEEKKTRAMMKDTNASITGMNASTLSKPGITKNVIDAIRRMTPTARL